MCLNQRRWHGREEEERKLASKRKTGRGLYETEGDHRESKKKARREDVLSGEHWNVSITVCKPWLTRVPGRYGECEVMTSPGDVYISFQSVAVNMSQHYRIKNDDTVVQSIVTAVIPLDKLIIVAKICYCTLALLSISMPQSNNCCGIIIEKIVGTAFILVDHYSASQSNACSKLTVHGTLTPQDRHV